MSLRRFLAALLLGFTAALLAPLPAMAGTIPGRATIEGIKGVAQSYSLSCEARSAVDWANFWGVSIRERKFQAKLPRSGNPDKGFVGNPSDPWGDIPPSSYGVHAEPVAALLRDYGLQAEARRGMTWDELRQEIAASRPVIVWVVGQVWRGTSQKYTAPDGQKTVVARYEHTMIVVGYSPSVVYLVDSYTGQNQTHPLRDFLASWKTLGNMAIVGQVKAKEPTAQIFIPAVLGSPAAPSAPGALDAPQPEAGAEVNTEVDTGITAEVETKEEIPLETEDITEAITEPTPPKTYIVRRGDFLVGVARSLAVNWRKLAAFNHIGYPYIIYTGQVLKIP